MAATRLYLKLNPSERKALDRLAIQDVRDPRDQLRYLIRKAAMEANMWPSSAELSEPQRSTQEHTRAAHANG